MLIDLTGVHLHTNEKVNEFIEQNGFLTDFHKFFIDECIANDLPYKNHFSLAEVAEKCGYTDYVYFSKKFKEKVGISPMLYKKSGLK